nr:unnamed protein product [Fasciola hepatica]
MGKSRAQCEGFEFDSELVWADWKPGIKYVKHIDVQNLNARSMELQYSLPATSEFQTVYPKTRKIAAGALFRLPITFAPVKRKFHEDLVTFKIKNANTFSVHLRATLPEYAINIPKKMNFGFVAVNESKSQIFSIRNLSSLETPFSLRIQSPFGANIVEGNLSSKEKRMIELKFQPQVDAAARVSPISSEVGFTRDQIFRVGLTTSIIRPGQKIDIPVYYQPKETGRDHVGYFKVITSELFGETMVKCTGQSPKVNVQTSVDHLVFDIVQLGQYDQRVLHIQNTCGLPTSYQLVTNASTGKPGVSTKDRQERFSATVFPIMDGSATGIISSGDEIRVVIGFVPPWTGHYHRRLVLLVSNQAPLFIDLLGTCHDLHEQPHHLKMQHLRIKQSPYDVQSVPSENEIQPADDYCSTSQSAFEEYARVKYVLETVIEPPPISIDPAYIEFTPNSECVRHAVRCAQYQIDTERLGLPPQENGASYGLTRTVVVQNQTTDVMLIRWTPLRSIPPLIWNKSIETRDVDQRSAGERWTRKTTGAFFIEPMECELAGGASSNFVITFVPNCLDQFFHHEFEGFAAYKIQRDCSLCSPDVLRAPHCIAVSCIGHTFAPSKQPFMPEFGIDRRSIRYPSMDAGETRFETFCVRNNSAQPLVVQRNTLSKPVIEQKNFMGNSCTIQLIPPILQIPPKSESILVVQCDASPTLKKLSQPVHENHSLQLLFNKRPDYELALPVIVDVIKAAVELEHDGELYFPPAQIGAPVRRKFAIHNMTSFKTRFEWVLLSQHEKELSVTPKTGLLRPNEIQYHTWTFCATENCQRVFTAYLRFARTELDRTFPVWPEHTGRVRLRVIAIAVPVRLQMEPNSANCDTIRIGTHSSVQLKLRNPCLASTYFTLTTQVTLYEDSITDTPSCPSAGISHEIPSACDDLVGILPSSGLLAGQSSLPVLVTVTPPLAGSYRIQLFYQLWSDETSTQTVTVTQTSDSAMTSVNSSCSLTGPIPIAMLIWNAVYPTLRITDIAGSGLLEAYGAVELWRDLGLDGVNVSLACEPTWNELKDAIGSRSTYRDHPKAKQPRGPVHDMFLAAGTAPEGTDPCESTVRLLVQNTSKVDARFAFLFPENLYDKLPNWAESGMYSDEELHHMYVQNNLLFKIQPRRVKLKSGEHVEIQITYNHRMTGANHLPVLWKIDGGREIQLNLLGITLPLHQPYLHFAQRRYTFPAVPLSTGDSRLGYLFRMQLRNPSARAVQYQVWPLQWPPDSTHPNRLLRQNADEPTAVGGCEYDMPVLYCSNQIGVVDAYGFGHLEWRFRPFEAKSYLAYCPIRIRDALGVPNSERDSSREKYNDTILLELVAIAYDPRQLGSKRVPAHPQRVQLPSAKERNGFTVDGDAEIAGLQAEHTLRRLESGESVWVQLSHHFLSLGRVTLGARVRRLFHMNHCAPNMFEMPTDQRAVPTYRYLFYPRLPEDMESLEIHPQFGHIRPGQSIQIEVTFTALGIPRIVDIELTCELRDEALEQAYENAMTVWQADCERRQVEFTYTDKNPLNELNRGGRDRWFKRITSEGDTIKNQPMAPKPHFLHLTLGLEVVSHEELQLNWPETWNTQFIDSTLLLQPIHTMAPVLNGSGPFSPVQQQCCVAMISSVVSGLLHDPDFVELIKQATYSESNASGDDPVPFFVQFRDRNCSAQMSNIEQNDRDRTPTVEPVGEKSIHMVMQTQPFEFDTWLTDTEQHHDRLVTDGLNDSGEEDEICMNNPGFRSLAETTIAQILRNILTEANVHEIELTSRFRAIVLPPNADFGQLDRENGDSYSSRDVRTQSPK